MCEPKQNTAMQYSKYSEKANSIWKANLAFLQHLHGYHSGYINSEDFMPLSITCSNLDLQSGKSSDGTTVFITPFPIKKLHTILDKQQVFTTRQLSNTLDGWNIYDALEVTYLIQHYMCFSNDLDYSGLIYEESTWQTRGIDWEGGERLIQQNEGSEWRVEFIFDKMDSNTPHVSPVLIDNSPMHKDKLSIAEICCILLCTARRLRHREYRRHRVIPITVISISGRLARVIHGYVDVSTNNLRIIKSPILDLNKEDTTYIMELLVSWCLGQPIGSTEWDNLD
ncbi:hypothetical protein F5B21DRAFT_103969 [Xylaria acuta]|nr:hypothetical protein F5B21DRAFT_103969 [Xylaria acuta]